MESIDTRCPWCLGSDRYKAYHDLEWGRPVRDEQKMFEYLILETFQAGLSWITILNKRDNFREAFFDFNADKIARMDDKDVDPSDAKCGNHQEINRRSKLPSIMPKCSKRCTTAMSDL